MFIRETTKNLVPNSPVPTSHRAVMLTETASTNFLAPLLLFAKYQLWEGIDSDACLYQGHLECLEFFFCYNRMYNLQRKQLRWIWWHMPAIKLGHGR